MNIRLTDGQVAELMYLNNIGYKYVVGYFDNGEFITGAYDHEPIIDKKGGCKYTKRNPIDRMCRTHHTLTFMMEYEPLEIEQLISPYIIIDKRDIKIIK